MNLDLISIFLILCFFLWIICHIVERRRIVNGLLFFMSAGSLVFLAIYMGIRDDIRILSMLGGLLALGLLILIPILVLLSIYILFSTGWELMKKEGVSLAHGLSFLFGLGVVGSSVLAPFIRNRIRSRFLLGTMDFFLGCFSYFVLGFIVYLTASLIYNLYPEKKDKDYLIVLGSGLNKDRVTPLLAGRIDRALDFYRGQLKYGRRAKIIMSGGQGEDEEISEALAMKNYALERGLADEEILVEDRSRTTEENLAYSTDLMAQDSEKENPKALFFTSNYHVFRAGLLAKSMDLDLNGRGARVKLYFYISAMIREYIAVLVMHKKFNIFMLVLILALNILKAF